MSNPDRREFVKTTLAGSAALMAGASASTAGAAGHERPTRDAISLATWSIVRSFRAGVWTLPDVARICREDFGIDGIEYVTSFFESPVERYLERLNEAAADHGVTNVLIMVDGEGDMVSKDKGVRMQASYAASKARPVSTSSTTLRDPTRARSSSIRWTPTKGSSCWRRAAAKTTCRHDSQGR